MFFVEKYHPTLEDNTHWLKKFVFLFVIHIAVSRQKKAPICLEYCHICLTKPQNQHYSKLFMRARYLPMMSNSRFTTVPTWKVWKLVCSKV